MVQMAGKYAHVKNENLDQYFKAVGVPYIARKIMNSTSPTLEITINEQGEYHIKVATMMRTVETKFKLNEEYNEHMPGGVLKSKTTLEGDCLVTESISPTDGSKTWRSYEFTDETCTITYKHETSGIEGKRFFKRITA